MNRFAAAWFLLSTLLFATVACERAGTYLGPGGADAEVVADAGRGRDGNLDLARDDTAADRGSRHDADGGAADGDAQWLDVPLDPGADPGLDDDGVSAEGLDVPSEAGEAEAAAAEVAADADGENADGTDDTDALSADWAGEAETAQPLCGNGLCEPSAGEWECNCPQDCGGCCNGNFVCEPEGGENCLTCPEECGPCELACGDGFCVVEIGEHCGTCPADCGGCPPVCGDGVCQYGPDEDPWSCPADCGSCGDGVCGAGEDVAGCLKDCAPACGNGKCDGEENALPGDAHYCPTDCGACGDGVCGFQDFVLGCEDDDCSPACGDGICGDEESPFGCPIDCGPPCGDGVCEPGETTDGCPVDCGGCGDGICGKVGDSFEVCPEDCVAPCGDGKCSWGETGLTCAQDCGGCGDDVCSQIELDAGSCEEDCKGCGDGVCIDEETPVSCPSDCAVCHPFCDTDWECGDAGCDQLCGVCGDEEVCFQNLCCAPSCDDQVCGSDGCGGSCGECTDFEMCSNGLCVCFDDGGLEDNGTCTAATPLDPGSWSQLSLCPSSDEDWYAIQLPQGKTLVAGISYEYVLGDMDLFLYKQGNCVGHVAASTDGTGAEEITWSADTAATYLLLVRGVGKFPGNSYALSIWIGDPVCGDGICNGDELCQACPADCGVCCVDCQPYQPCELGQCVCKDDGGAEPNNSCIEPTVIQPVVLKGMTVCNNGDADWYMIHAVEGETLAIDLSFEHSVGNLDLYLYPQGNCVGYVAKSISISDHEAILYPSPFTRNYYILVVASGPAVGNSYDLQVAIYPASCGNGACAGQESCFSCPADCPCACGLECVAGVCQFTACQGKQCGPDGCGGSCGQCPPGSACVQSACVCQPGCVGKQCGPDGCGAQCGQCPAQHVCQDGTCQCVPLNCAAFPSPCGTYDDGCGALIQCSAGCPTQDTVDLFLVIGQSNARGRGQGPAAVFVEAGTAFEYDPVADALFPLQFPTGLPAGAYWTSDQTSFVVAFGRTWHELSGHVPVFVCRAKGGTALVESADLGNGDWTDVEDADGLYGTAIGAYLAALNHLAAQPDFLMGKKYVIWHQGETDADGAVLWSTYRDALVALFGKLDAEIGFDGFFISEIGYRLPYSALVTSQYLQVIKGQQQAQQSLANAVLASKLPRQFTIPCMGNQSDPECALWDNYHYETWAYEELGIDLATHAWTFASTGAKPLKPDL